MEQQGAPRTIRKKQTKKEAKNARKPLAVGMRVELLTGKRVPDGPGTKAFASGDSAIVVKEGVIQQVSLGPPPKVEVRLTDGRTGWVFSGHKNLAILDTQPAQPQPAQTQQAQTQQAQAQWRCRQQQSQYR